MNYSTIYTASVSEGLGMRVSLFVSGCHHHCKGCFNECTWDPNYGKPFTKETEDFLIEKINKPYIKGLSLAGGEPFFHSNRGPLLAFVKRVKEECPQRDIWCYTGAEIQDLLLCGKEEDTTGYQLLTYIDVLVDGPFILEQRDISLAFRGSRNQRIIDVQKTLSSGNIILFGVPQ